MFVSLFLDSRIFFTSSLVALSSIDTIIFCILVIKVYFLVEFMILKCQPVTQKPQLFNLMDIVVLSIRYTLLPFGNKFRHVFKRNSCMLILDLLFFSVVLKNNFYTNIPQYVFIIFGVINLIFRSLNIVYCYYIPGNSRFVSLNTVPDNPPNNCTKQPISSSLHLNAF